jgi:hypothetical protein
MIGGKEYWLDTWINEGRNGKKYLKHSFKVKDFAQVLNGTHSLAN